MQPGVSRPFPTKRVFSIQEEGHSHPEKSLFSPKRAILHPKRDFFAPKTGHSCTEGTEYPLQKFPVTEKGTKNSLQQTQLLSTYSRPSQPELKVPPNLDGYELESKLSSTKNRDFCISWSFYRWLRVTKNRNSSHLQVNWDAQEDIPIQDYKSQWPSLVPLWLEADHFSSVCSHKSQ